MERERSKAWATRLLIAMQTQDMPVNFRNPVAVDKNRYQDYVGQYQARPVADVETTFVKDGKLWSQLGDDLAEYLPAGDDTFFVKEGDLSSYTFSRDAQGHVTGYTSHRADGQEYQNKKIK